MKKVIRSIQTELMVNPKSIRSTRRREVECQTNEEYKKPVPVRYIQPKTGVDSSTQVSETELLEFDQEVEPLVDFLVQRTITTAVFAMVKELNIKHVHAYQSEYEAILQQEQEKAEKLRFERHQAHERIQELSGDSNVKVAESALTKILSIQISRDLINGIMNT